jgi:hypothetical protein
VRRWFDTPPPDNIQHRAHDRAGVCVESLRADLAVKVRRDIGNGAEPRRLGRVE